MNPAMQARPPRGLWTSSKMVVESASDTLVEVAGTVSTLARAANTVSYNAQIAADFSNEIFTIEMSALRASRLKELRKEHPDLELWSKYEPTAQAPAE